MKHIYISTTIVLLTLSVGLFSGCTTQANQPNEKTSIVWLTDYQVALEKAKDENKPILVDFYTDWCGWCKKMDQSTYQDEKIINLSQKFIMVKIDGDKHSDLVKNFNISGYPSTAFVGPDGKHLSTAVGYQKTSSMAAKMKQIKTYLAQNKK